MELFFQNCLIAAKQVVILYVIVAAGYICDKTGVFTEKTARACNNLLFCLITPCVIINSFITTEFTADTARGLALAAGCGVLTHITGIVLSLPFFNDVSKPTNPIFKFACVYGNMGYMALPLANAVLGAQGVFYCSVGIIMFQVFCFTHGAWVMNRGNEGDAKFHAKNLILNPGVIAVAIGLPLFLLRVKAPEVLSKPISFIGSMNTPLAMLMLGTYMSNAGLRTIFKNKEQYLAAAVKIIAVPLAVFGVLKLTGIVTGALFTSAIIQASAPSANNTVMFSAKYGRDTGVASKTVAFISFVSVLTMPVMIALTQM